MPPDPRPGRSQQHDEELRRARRAFVRSHHPDRGGDPVAFAEGLRRFDALVRGSGPDARTPRPGPAVTVLRRPRGLAGWVGHLSRLAARRRRPPRVR